VDKLSATAEAQSATNSSYSGNGIKMSFLDARVGLLLDLPSFDIPSRCSDI